MSFRLDKISDTEYVLENGETGNSFQVPFEASRLYDRFGPPGAATYKIESEYNGPAGPIFDSLIPKLNLIYETFKPKKDQESFESKPAADEHDHGKTTYCQEYQKSIYKIRLKKDIELDFSFYNGRLRSITASRHGSYLLQDNLKKSLRTTLYEITVKCEQWPWPPGSKPRHIPHPVAVKVLKRLWKKHLQHRDKPSRRKTRCWYCNRRESSEESAAVFQMHKTLARGEKKYLRDTYVKKWATYQKMSVPVPRCRACVMRHFFSALVFWTSLFAGGAWILHNSLHHDDVTSRFVTYGPYGVLLFAVAAALLILVGIKPKRRCLDYPPMREANKRGFSVGDQPGSIDLGVF